MKKFKFGCVPLKLCKEAKKNWRMTSQKSTSSTRWIFYVNFRYEKIGTKWCVSSAGIRCWQRLLPYWNSEHKKTVKLNRNTLWLYETVYCVAMPLCACVLPYCQSHIHWHATRCWCVRFVYILCTLVRVAVLPTQDSYGSIRFATPKNQ